MQDTSAAKIPAPARVFQPDWGALITLDKEDSDTPGPHPATSPGPSIWYSIFQADSRHTAADSEASIPTGRYPARFLPRAADHTGNPPPPAVSESTHESSSRTLSHVQPDEIPNRNLSNDVPVSDPQAGAPDLRNNDKLPRHSVSNPQVGGSSTLAPIVVTAPL